MNNFVKRTLSGIGFVAIMLAALLTNRFVFGFVMLLSLVVMMKEFLHMTCGSEYCYSQILSILSGATLFLLVFLIMGSGLSVRYLSLAIAPVFLIMITSLYVKDKKDFNKFANLYTSILYIAIPWTMSVFAVFDSAAQFNGLILLAFFIIVWASDVGAYLFGITLGQKYGKKLFPSVSPKKSWIGFWGGVLTAVIAAVFLHKYDIFQFSIYHSIILAILLNIAGVYGDLIESQWKRHYDLKDSSNLIPGHGGLLDRFDSALLAVPVGVIYLFMTNLL